MPKVLQGFDHWAEHSGDQAQCKKHGPKHSSDDSQPRHCGSIISPLSTTSKPVSSGVWRGACSTPTMPSSSPDEGTSKSNWLVRKEAFRSEGRDGSLLLSIH